MGFRVESRWFDGRYMEGGWVLKTFQGVPTLVPRPCIAAAHSDSDSVTNTDWDDDDDDDARSVISNISRACIERAEAEGRSGLNPEYAQQEVQDSDNEVLAFENGVIAWRYNGEVDYEGKRIRIVLRKVVVADSGHGRDIVNRMEHACLAADPYGTGIRPDLVLLFLQSIPGAQESHERHGYTPLRLNGRYILMYKQIAGHSAFGAYGLSPGEVEEFADLYSEA